MLMRAFGATGLKLPLPGRWQAELWYCPADVVIPFHTHSRVDSVLVFLGGRMLWFLGNKRNRVLGLLNVGAWFRVPAGVPHAAMVLGRCGLFLNLQRWTGEKSSAATDLTLV
jgi:mannose-6-phosphate isomerase-like protein (cupin superfamily)